MNVTEAENEQALQVYREKFADFIKWNHIEPDGLAYALRVLSERGDGDAFRALEAMAMAALRELVTLIDLGKEEMSEQEREFVGRLAPGKHLKDIATEMGTSEAELRKLFSSVTAKQEGSTSARAIAGFLRCVTDNIHRFNAMAKTRQHDFARWAVRRNCWPGLIPIHPESRAEMEQLVDGKLSVGAFADLAWRKRRGRTFSFQTLGVRVAIPLYEKIESYRTNSGWAGEDVERARKLPAFTRASSSEWWAVADQIFMERFGENFEDREEFRAYWSGVAKAKGIREAERSSVRNRIKADVRQAFIKLPRR